MGKRKTEDFDVGPASKIKKSCNDSSSIPTYTCMETEFSDKYGKKVEKIYFEFVGTNVCIIRKLTGATYHPT